MESPVNFEDPMIDGLIRREIKDRTETMARLHTALEKLPEKDADELLAAYFGIFSRDSFELLRTYRLKEICRALEEKREGLTAP